MYKIPTEQEILDARKEMKVRVAKEVKEFNRPNKYAVAINCSHIGDDNDYSCFLSDVISKLYSVDKKLAWKLFRTDSMVIDNDISFDDFCKHVEERNARQIEIEEMHKQQERFYVD